MSALVQLLPPKPQRYRSPATIQYAIKSAPPFVEIAAGEYTHRVRSAQLIEWISLVPVSMQNRSWFAVKFWCGGMGLMGGKKRGHFVAEPSPGRMVCATCEGRAIGAGQAGTPVIAGRPVKFSPRIRGLGRE